MNNHRSNASLLVLLGLVLLGLAACATPPPRIEESLDRSPGLTTVNPNSIAVLEVEDVTPGKKAESLTAFMRREIEKALILRNYAPMTSIYVDAHMTRAMATPGTSITEAAHLSTLANKAEEDGILAVQIRQWDESTILLNNRVRFEAQIVLFGSKNRTKLWSGRVWGEVVAGGDRAAPRDPQQRSQAAAREFIRELIGRLPRRKV